MENTYLERFKTIEPLLRDYNNSDVTIMLQDTNELVPAFSIGIPSDDDRLDEGHPVIFV